VKKRGPCRVGGGVGGGVGGVWSGGITSQGLGSHVIGRNFMNSSLLLLQAIHRESSN